MNINDTHLYEQAISYALNGQREQAYDLLKFINVRNSGDINLTFWRMYTAPDLRKAEGLYNLAKLNDPNNIILVEAEAWLNYRRAGREIPSGGFSRFPPRPIGTLANPVANNIKPNYFPPMVFEKYQPAPFLQVPIAISINTGYQCLTSHIRTVAAGSSVAGRYSNQPAYSR
jgi:hypothetical protein